MTVAFVMLVLKTVLLVLHSVHSSATVTALDSDDEIGDIINTSVESQGSVAVTVAPLITVVLVVLVENVAVLVLQ